MRGGVLSKVTDEPLDEHVKRIIRESRLELVSHGMYGFVFSVTLDGDSGFMDYQYGRLATTFVMKLIPIDMYMAHRIDGKYARRTNDLRYVKRETSCQRKVYKESLEKHGYAPCPAVLHQFVYTLGELEQLLPDQFSYAYGEEKPMVYTHNKELRIGVIFMEYMNGQPRSLYKESLKDKTIIEQKKGEATRLYCMALECGVNHRDAHLNNFLINDQNELTLIDFGIANLLTPEENILALIPEGESHDTALRDALRTLSTGSNTWFLTDPFHIAPYPPPLSEEVVERCKDGLCSLDFDPREGAAEEKANRRILAERARAKQNALERKRKYDGERAILYREAEAILAQRRQLKESKDPIEETRERAARREKDAPEIDAIVEELIEKKRIRAEEERLAKQDALERERRVVQQKEEKAAEKSARKAAWDRKQAEQLAAEEARVEAWMHAHPEAHGTRREEAHGTRREEAHGTRVRAEKVRAPLHKNAPTIPKERLNDATLEELKAEIIHVRGDLPDLSEFNGLHFKDEKQMYLYYLSNINRGGTRKRIKVRTRKYHGRVNR